MNAMHYAVMIRLWDMFIFNKEHWKREFLLH